MEDREGLRVEDQQVLYGGVELVDDDWNLVDCGVSSGWMLRVVGGIRGGGVEDQGESKNSDLNMQDASGIGTGIFVG